MIKKMSECGDVIKKLIKSHKTISTMESCTAGMIASVITDTEGASAVFPGGYVTYSNSAKIQAGVKEEIIKKYGVYSKECAEEMARTAKEKFGTDIAIGITGTTGNTDPNNSDSVIGRAFYCIISGISLYSYEMDIDVSAMSRHETKKLYTKIVFEKLSECII